MKPRPDPNRAPAVFLDRDNTIIEDPGYISHPDQVRLLPDVAEAIRRLSATGHRIVLVSNQSGIARGLFTEEDLAAIHTRLESLLAAEGARLDGSYYCPFLDGPDAVVAAYRQESFLRKPNPGMLIRAAEELHIDLPRSWMIGDSSRDVEAGRRAGCRTILLRPAGTAADDAACTPTYTADTLVQAAELVENDVEELPKADEVSSAGEHADKVETLLARIHDQLERSHRQTRQQDFSVLRLFGALLQMLAIVTALWGFASLIDGRDGTAVARLALACFFQLACLTATAVDRFP